MDTLGVAYKLFVKFAMPFNLTIGGWNEDRLQGNPLKPA